MTPEFTYGQKEPMENEAMARTFDAQARAIWPQEKETLRRVFSKKGLRVLDVGCGTGEISSRVVKEFAPKRVVGLDLSERNLRRARELYPPSNFPGLSFEEGNAAEMGYEDSEFDVALCRHMLQAVPEPVRVIREMIRVVKPGGWLYFLAEDYGMLFFHPTKYDTDEFWREYAGKAASKSGSDLRHGRTMPAQLAALRCGDIQATYLVIDTLRVERDLVADIFVHWRDGFEAWIGKHSGHSRDDVQKRFNDIIECTRNPLGYAAWLIPSISAKVTEGTKPEARKP